MANEGFDSRGMSGLLVPPGVLEEYRMAWRLWYNLGSVHALQLRGATAPHRIVTGSGSRRRLRELAQWVETCSKIESNGGWLVRFLRPASREQTAERGAGLLQVLQVRARELLPRDPNTCYQWRHNQTKKTIIQVGLSTAIDAEEPQDNRVVVQRDIYLVLERKQHIWIRGGTEKKRAPSVLPLARGGSCLLRRLRAFQLLRQDLSRLQPR